MSIEILSGWDFKKELCDCDQLRVMIQNEMFKHAQILCFCAVTCITPILKSSFKILPSMLNALNMLSNVMLEGLPHQLGKCHQGGYYRGGDSSLTPLSSNGVT